MEYERLIRFSVECERPQQSLTDSLFHRYVFDDGTVWTEFYRTSNGYLLRFPDIADFEVSASGENVVAHPVIGADETTVEHLHINQVLPLALSRQGRPSFHASAVTVPRGAVAFLGKTGMGKSTLAASFALKGAEFLTDDSLIIEETGDEYLALPSHASLRLWDDSVEALVDERTRHVAAISYSTKARLLAGEALSHREEPLPLIAAFVLEREGASEVSVRALAGAERHMAWVNNSFLLDIEDRELLARHFDWTHRIAEAIPTFALDYPRNYGMLPEVREFIRKHVARL